jgi:hypothetical protein
MAAILFGGLAFVVLYWLPMRRWFVRWGATASDVTRIMAGDAPPSVPATRRRWRSPSERDRNT